MALGTGTPPQMRARASTRTTELRGINSEYRNPRRRRGWDPAGSYPTDADGDTAGSSPNDADADTAGSDPNDADGDTADSSPNSFA